MLERVFLNDERAVLKEDQRHVIEDPRKWFLFLFLSILDYKI